MQGTPGTLEGDPWAHPFFVRSGLCEFPRLLSETPGPPPSG